jgi:hypothetical protein
MKPPANNDDIQTDRVRITPDGLYIGERCAAQVAVERFPESKVEGSYWLCRYQLSLLVAAIRGDIVTMQVRETEPGYVRTFFTTSTQEFALMNVAEPD